ncbi:hypothetical protein ACQCU1_16155 [Sutcliffiella horikoshii]|uniref:hypothetical protein n=1 Tax=Sutcliffiella horikoshii TaxID=79883 RepID=UPI003CED3220
MFLGVAILRNLLFFQDTLGYVLTTFGYIFLVSYVKFADEKIGATKRDKIILEQDLWLFLEWLPSTFINSVPLTVGQNIKFEG